MPVDSVLGLSQRLCSCILFLSYFIGIIMEAAMKGFFFLLLSPFYTMGFARVCITELGLLGVFLYFLRPFLLPVPFSFPFLCFMNCYDMVSFVETHFLRFFLCSNLRM